MKRTYSKGNPEKELLPKQKKRTVELETQQVPNNNIQIESYQKISIEEMPKAFFVIISGGQVREKDYLKIISAHDRFKRIKLKFNADEKELIPDRMFDLALSKKAHYKTSQNQDDEPDKIYLVSDVDHFKKDLLRIKPKCEDEGFKLIISNPCFEVWLYYAYKSTKLNMKIPKKESKISSNLKTWLGEKVKGGIEPNKVIFNIHSNIENAKNNYNEDENGIPTLFSTNMYLLANDLLQFIEPELLKMIKHNKEVEKKFRSLNKK